MSRKSLDVVHVAETIRGGIATYLREVLKLQVKRFGPERVAVIAPRSQLSDLGEQSGIRTVPVEKARSRIATAWRARRALSAINKQYSVKTVHVHSAFAGMVCRTWLRSPGNLPRLVYCPHGWAFTRIARSARIAEYVERTLSRRCDAIVCVSQAEKEAALRAGLPAEKLAVIHNGLPDRPIASDKNYTLWRPSALRLVFAGRFDRQKGFDVLLAALKRLEREIEVHVFGDSVLGEYSVNEVSESVHLHGWQNFDTMAPFIVSCDAVVMPSRWEALGLTALEAMRAEKPVIASRVGGLVELVEDGVTGILIPPGDEAGLAGVLNAVSAAQLAGMGKRARQRFLAEFLIEQCEARLAAVYESISRG